MATACLAGGSFGATSRAAVLSRTSRLVTGCQPTNHSPSDAKLSPCASSVAPPAAGPLDGTTELSLGPASDGSWYSNAPLEPPAVPLSLVATTSAVPAAPLGVRIVKRPSPRSARTVASSLPNVILPLSVNLAMVAMAIVPPETGPRAGVIETTTGPSSVELTVPVSIPAMFPSMPPASEERPSSLPASSPEPHPGAPRATKPTRIAVRYAADAGRTDANVRTNCFMIGAPTGRHGAATGARCFAEGPTSVGIFGLPDHGGDHASVRLAATKRLVDAARLRSDRAPPGHHGRGEWRPVRHRRRLGWPRGLQPLVPSWLPAVDRCVFRL